MAKNYFKQSFKKAGKKFGKNVSNGFDKSWDEHGPHELSDSFKTEVTSESTYSGPFLSFTRPIILVGKKAVSTAYNFSKDLLAKLDFEKRCKEAAESIGIDRGRIEQEWGSVWKVFGGEGNSFKNLTTEKVEQLHNKFQESRISEFMDKNYTPKDFNPEKMAEQVNFGQVDTKKYTIKDFSPESFLEGKVKNLKFENFPSNSNKVDISKFADGLSDNTSKFGKIYNNPFSSWDDFKKLFSDNAFQNPIDSDIPEIVNESDVDKFMEKFETDTTNSAPKMQIRSIDKLGYTFYDDNVFVSDVKEIDTGALSEEIRYYEHEGNTVSKSMLDIGDLMHYGEEFFGAEPNSDDYIVADAQSHFIFNEGLKTGKETWNNMMDGLDDLMDLDGADFHISHTKGVSDFLGTTTNYMTQIKSSKDSFSFKATSDENPFKKSFEKAGAGANEKGFHGVIKTFNFYQTLIEYIEDHFVLDIWKDKQEDEKKSMEEMIRKLY